MSVLPSKFRIDASHYGLVVRRPVSILMVTLAVAVFGWVSYQRLALTLMPDMSYPTLTVRTVYPGTAPEEIENIISRQLEQQLGIIPKLVSISSVSKAGQSDVILEFQWKTDMDLVAQEVREKIDRLRLPDGAQRPLLLHYDPSLDPILRVGLAGPQSLYELRYLAENDVKRRLEAIGGVAAVQIKGGLEEQFLVALDESKLAQLRLDIGQIASRLQQGNVNMPGGNLREGQTEYLIRTLNEFKTIEEIAALVVARQNNVDIRLRDVATVSRFHEDRQVITRVNGHESVEIEIFKEADANVLGVAAAVKDALFGTETQRAYVEKLRKRAPPRVTPKQPDPNAKLTPAQQRAEGELEMRRQRSAAQEVITRRQMTDYLNYQLPTGARVELLSDQSVFIDNSIREVKDNAVYGGLIAVAVLFLFLRNVTQTIIVSLCIPISILATFAPMHMAGVSLNIISLGGLALGVGNLVDNAIVVLESVFRCREEGDDHVTSVVRGTSEVAMPVIASTLTTVAVFFPIVFVEGVAGQVFGDMALAVVFSQIASLIAALYLIPMLAAKLTVQGGEAGAMPAGIASQWRETAVVRRPGEWRLTAAGRGLVVLFMRAVFGTALVLAALVKLLAAALSALVWPLVAAVEWIVRWRAARRRRLAASAAEAIVSASWWSRLGAWASKDRLGRLDSVRIWPGMLSFGAPQNFGAGLARVRRWLFGRHWRWIFLLVVPALVVAGICIAVKVQPPLGQPGPRLPPGMPLMPGMPAPKPWWNWFFIHSWWQMVLIIPGVVPLAFATVRFAAELALRFLGTALQTLALVSAHTLVGLVRCLGLLLGPTAGAGLAWFETGTEWLQENYPRLLTVTLNRRFAVMGGALAALLITTFAIVPRLGSELIPQVHQGEFNLAITLPIGTPIERTAEVAASIDDIVRGQPEVERTAVSIGSDETSTTAREMGEHTAQLTVRLKNQLQAKHEKILIDRLRTEFSDFPDVKFEVTYPTLFSFRSPIEVEIHGHDLSILKRLSREAEAVLTTRVNGLVDVRSTLQAGHPEIEVIYDRDRLAEYGLNLRTVADLVRNKVQGRTATQFRKEDQLIDIVVRLREEDRFGIEELRRLVVNPGGQIPITLSAVATLTINEGPSQIRRVDQQRTALITANVRGADLATVSRDIVTVMNSIEFPPGFSFSIAGQNREMQTSLNSLMLAFGLAVFLVYIVMASQFESLVQPLLIMVTVPLALVGVSLVLWTAGIPLSIMVFLGLIILAGIVVNNAIVLIDYINTQRDRGLELRAAIIEAGRARLRPILMTMLTTVLGLVPMALGLGEGAEIRAPMAITVIVGLSVSTLLTLVVIPVLYFQFGGKRGPVAPEPAGEPESELETVAK